MRKTPITPNSHEESSPTMNLRSRVDVRLVGGLHRVIARTAAVVFGDEGCYEPNPEPVREFVHKRAFADSGEAWKLGLRIESALRNGGTIDLRHWDMVRPGDLPADSLLPAAFNRWLERRLSQ